MQGLAVGVEHERAVAEHAPGGGELRVPGDLAAVARHQVVSALQLSLYAHRGKHAAQGARKAVEVVEATRLVVRHEAEVEVPLVVVHRSAPGHAAHHADVSGLHVGPVDLFKGVLVAPDDDGRLVDVEEEIPVLRVQIPERPFLKRKVKGRVRHALVVDEDQGQQTERRRTPG